MRSELDKYGIQMPAFSKIGGILANELSVDEAACEPSDIQLFLIFLRIQGQKDSDWTCLFLVHAAVIAINEAIDRGQAPVTMAALNNPNAMLKNAKEALAEDYQDTLSQAKTRKLNQSSRKVQKATNDDLYVIVFIRTLCCTDQLCSPCLVSLFCTSMGNGKHDFCSEWFWQLRVFMLASELQ